MKRISASTLLVTITLVFLMILVNGSAFAQKQVRIPYISSELSPQHFQAHKFAEEVNKRLPNQFAFRFYPNGQLGPENSWWEQLRLGTMEMGVVVSAAINVDRRFAIFDLPWLFKDSKNARKAMTGPLKDKVGQLLEQKAGVKVVGIYDHGFRHLMSNRTIVKPEDMKGLKVRVAGGKVRQDLFRRLGANPTPIDWTEVFSALQTGVVEGAEASTYGLYEAKLHQVCSNLSLTHHNYTSAFLVASTAFWKQLTPEQQKVFEHVGKEITEWTWDSAEQNEKKYMVEMRKQTKINEVNIAAFQAASSDLIDDYIKTYGGEWIKEIRAAAQ